MDEVQRTGGEVFAGSVRHLEDKFGWFWFEKLRF
jgi:hypothetical protein